MMGRQSEPDQDYLAALDANSETVTPRRGEVRRMQTTVPFLQSLRERKKVEMLFAHLKQNFKFRRLKLRGLAGSAEEFLLVATVKNLRKLVRLRPPDTGQSRQIRPA